MGCDTLLQAAVQLCRITVLRRFRLQRAIKKPSGYLAVCDLQHLARQQPFYRAANHLCAAVILLVQQQGRTQRVQLSCDQPSLAKHARLRGKINPVRRLQIIERLDPERIPPQNSLIRLAIIGGQRIHAAQLLNKGAAMTAEKRQDHRTIRLAGRPFCRFQLRAQGLMIVDFPIDRQKRPVLGISKGLRSTCNVDNGQSLMGKNSVVCLNHTGPIGSTVMLS